MLEAFFLNLPPTLQSLAMTYYGWRMYRQRYGGLIPAPYDGIVSVFDCDDAELKAAQAQRFSQLVNHASSTVPYYQDLFRKLDIKPENVNVDNMAEVFPVISKQEIIANPMQFITLDRQFLKGSFILNTSGSSGTPMRVVSSLEARRINYAFFELALQEYGLHYRSRSTTFAGRIFHKENGDCQARFDYFNNTQYLSSYLIADDTIEAYVRELNNWKPDFVDSYPSVLVEVATLAEAKGLNLTFQPKLLLTSSETLTEGARERITDFFGSPVLDHYGCTEMAVSAYSGKDQYIVHPLYSVMELESIGDNSYALLATGLINFAMPLIRYAIGDCVNTNTPENSYVYQAIDGRVDDLVTTPEGRKVGRLDPAFKGVHGVAMAQVVQHALDHLELRVVLSEGRRDKFDEWQLISNFRKRTSSKMRIEISYHDDIERAANGKFKSVVSLL